MVSKQKSSNFAGGISLSLKSEIIFKNLLI
jgi:hypothetical protein